MSKLDVLAAARRYEPFVSRNETLSLKWVYREGRSILTFHSYSTPIAELITYDTVKLLNTKRYIWSVTTNRHLSFIKNNFKCI